MYGLNWLKVADHVGTHSMLECMTHFLQLPIEDDFLDEIERGAAALPGASDHGNGGGGAQSVEEVAAIGHVPLAGTAAAPANPLMSAVSTAGLVSCACCMPKLSGCPALCLQLQQVPLDVWTCLRLHTACALPFLPLSSGRAAVCDARAASWR